MFQPIWSILCKSSVIDPTSNNISLIEALEQLTATIDDLKPLADKPKGQPILAPANCELVTLWERADAKGSGVMTTTFEFRDPEERILLSGAPYESKFKENSRRHRMRNKIQGIPLTKNGIYHFDVLLKNDETGKFERKNRIPLQVELKVGGKADKS